MCLLFWLCNVSLQKYVEFGFVVLFLLNLFECILFLFLFLFKKHWEGEDQVSVSEADESWTQSKPGEFPNDY